jgi:hypothetical protein
MNYQLETTCKNTGTCPGCVDTVRGKGASWHITIGHAGFNSPTNNTESGYLSFGRAWVAMMHYAKKQRQLSMATMEVRS